MLVCEHNTTQPGPGAGQHQAGCEAAPPTDFPSPQHSDDPADEDYRGLIGHLEGTDPTCDRGLAGQGCSSWKNRQDAASSLTFDVQLFLHALDVGGRFLLDKVEDLDGVGHPEDDVLQVWEKVCDGEARQGDRVLAGETQQGLHLLLLSIPTQAFGEKTASLGQ